MTQVNRRYLGIDLAWNCERNGSGIAIGAIENGTLLVNNVVSGVKGIDRIKSWLATIGHIAGIAIDAPLIVNNRSGARPCETELSAMYRRFHAGTHVSNLNSPWNSGRQLSEILSNDGFAHLNLSADRWQIECYPHPAMVEVFNLDERIPYKQKKHRKVVHRRDGQKVLMRHLRALQKSCDLPLELAGAARDFLDPERIDSLRGKALKDNEDGLDAIMCVYVAAWFGSGLPCRVFGGVNGGYIVVPNCKQLKTR